MYELKVRKLYDTNVNWKPYITLVGPYADDGFDINNGKYVVYQIDGIDPPTATISTSTIAGYDGSVYGSSYLGNRNIVLYIKLQKTTTSTIEDARIQLYQFFAAKTHVRLEYTNDNRDVYCDGYVESCSVTPFTNNEVAQVSIICPDPYWYNIESETVELAELSGSIDGFSLATDVDEDDTVALGDTYAGYYGAYVDAGDGCGFELELHISVTDLATASGDLTITNAMTGEFIEIDTSILNSITTNEELTSLINDALNNDENFILAGAVQVASGDTTLSYTELLAIVDQWVGQDDSIEGTVSTAYTVDDAYLTISTISGEKSITITYTTSITVSVTGIKYTDTEGNTVPEAEDDESLSASYTLTSEELASLLGGSYGDIGTINSDGILIGDVNLDGIISVADITLLQEYIADESANGTSDLLDSTQLIAADTNGDGSISRTDITTLLAYYTLLAASSDTLENNDALDSSALADSFSAAAADQTESALLTAVTLDSVMFQLTSGYNLIYVETPSTVTIESATLTYTPRYQGV